MFILHPQLAKDCIKVCELSLSSVLLLNDAQYPWLVLVPKVADCKDVIDLEPEQQMILWQESALISRVLKQVYQADKLNVAALGNMVEQLHVHHIARFKHDPSWPKPVWGQLPAIPYTETALDTHLTRLRRAIDGLATHTKDKS